MEWPQGEPGTPGPITAEWEMPEIEEDERQVGEEPEVVVDRDMLGMYYLG